MKKYSSQITIALVCAILGFFLTYQLRNISKEELKPTDKQTSVDVSVEVEQLKKQKEDLTEKISELEKKINEYENAAASESLTAKKLKEELDETRLLVGAVDLAGEGVNVYITPQEMFLSGNLEVEMIPIYAEDIIKIINELNSSGAEAVAVNGIRITSRIGVSNTSNYIVINDIKISVRERITISAIGKKDNLLKGLEFPSAIPNLPSYNVVTETSDKVVIPKVTKSIEFKYANPVKE